MKFISIFVNLFLILLFSCEKNPANNNPDDTGSEDSGMDYSVCENCIWLQNDCSGNWILGYNSDSAFGGFQMVCGVCKPSNCISTTLSRV